MTGTPTDPRRGTADSLPATVAGLMGRARDDLGELVGFRSVADPVVAPRAECAKAAQWVVDRFTKVGLLDVTASRTADGSDCVHGHAPGPPGAPTVLLYCHYDVQPPLGEQDWTSPIWELTERGGRWYGRGAADCKGNIVAHLTALRALRQRYGVFPCTVKLICEGFEAMRSALEQAFDRPMTTAGQGGSIPLCNVFADTFPDAEIMLLGVEEPECLIHAPNKSVHPAELERIALTEALFLAGYAAAAGRR